MCCSSLRFYIAHPLDFSVGWFFFFQRHFLPVLYIFSKSHRKQRKSQAFITVYCFLAKWYIRVCQIDVCFSLPFPALSLALSRPFERSFPLLRSYSLALLFSLALSFSRSFTAADNYASWHCVHKQHRHAHSSISNAALKSRSNCNEIVQQILFTRSLIIMFFCIQLSHNYCKIVPSALVIERHKQLLMNVAVQRRRRPQQQ